MQKYIFQRNWGGGTTIGKRGLLSIEMFALISNYIRFLNVYHSLLRDYMNIYIQFDRIYWKKTANEKRNSNFKNVCAFE